MPEDDVSWSVPILRVFERELLFGDMKKPHGKGCWLRGRSLVDIVRVRSGSGWRSRVRGEGWVWNGVSGRRDERELIVVVCFINGGFGYGKALNKRQISQNPKCVTKPHLFGIDTIMDVSNFERDAHLCNAPRISNLYLT